METHMNIMTFLSSKFRFVLQHKRSGEISSINKHSSTNPFKNFISLITLTLIALFVFTGCELVLGEDPGTSNREIFDLVWNDISDRYALLDVKKIDWNAVHDQFDPQISNELSEDEFFDIMAEMFYILDDKHMILSKEDRMINSGKWTDTNDNFALKNVMSMYPSVNRKSKSEMFSYGTLNDTVGYVHVRAFIDGKNDSVTQDQDWPDEIDGILRELKDCKSIVVDVRNNLGGLPANVDKVAGRFTKSKTGYCVIATKDGPGRNDFSKTYTQKIEPHGNTWEKPVVLLTNAVTISAGEEFVMAMKEFPQVTQCGGTTAGAFSLSLLRPLPNGWYYSMSVQKVTDIRGKCYEGIGLSPDIEHSVHNSAEDFAAGYDRQIEYALTLAESLAAGR